MMAKSSLNLSMNSSVLGPTIPPSDWRIVPPAIITSMPLIGQSVLATLTLLVITSRPARSVRYSATRSVVVPMLMNSEALSGMREAVSLAIPLFSSAIRIFLAR